MDCRHLKRIFILLVLLSAGIACRFVVPSEETVGLPGCYQVTFLGFSQSTENISTWRYRVEEESCAQDLSNWMLELPACATVVDASPSPWEIVQPDPNYQLNGIKWQTGTDFQSGEFSVVLSGDLIPGTVRVGVKGPDVAIGEITGPVCNSTTTTPPIATLTVVPSTITPTVTTTLEAIVSPTPLPPTEVPPTLQPPPASAGTILITDNDQTLTFTCNGNAVEVRGNANVITLLGSCSSITVRGNGNQVYWQSGAPVITNTGNENIISQR